MSFKNIAETLSAHLKYFIYLKASGNKIRKILKRIRQVNFTHQPGRKNPRISKQPYTTWSGGAKNKSAERYNRRKGWA